MPPEAGEGQLLGVAVAVGGRSAIILSVRVPPRQDLLLLLLLLLLPLLYTDALKINTSPDRLTSIKWHAPLRNSMHV